ncbi:M48 family metalloprotease [Candidatus Babeliales bacterium]|nr:M48 family metalloprotease [Candidatus Babeliales bacterium]
MLTTPEITPATPTIAPALSEQETITHVLKELEDLKNIVLIENNTGDWSITHPMLFGFILTTVAKLSVPLACRMPDHFFIDFKGIQSEQASAHIMTNGTTQLHVGSELIRKSLTEEDNLSLRSLQWTLAHELSHLCDPKFKLSAKLYLVRDFLNKFGLYFATFSLAQMVFQNTGHQAFFAACGFIILNKIFTIALHRNYEYTADKLSLQAMPDITLSEIENTLTSMQQAVKPLCLTEPTNAINMLIGGCFPSLKSKKLYKKIVLLSFFSLHPSISKRLEYLKKLNG